MTLASSCKKKRHLIEDGLLTVKFQRLRLLGSVQANVLVLRLLYLGGMATNHT